MALRGGTVESRQGDQLGCLHHPLLTQEECQRHCHQLEAASIRRGVEQPTVGR